MAEDNFKKFKKRYEEGKISTTQMPPLPAGPGPGIGRAVAGAVMNRGRKMLMDRLEKSRQAGAKARNAPKEGSKGRSGTLSERLEATRARPRTKKESEKFGPLVKRQENLPAKQSRAIVKREENLPAVAREGRREVQNYKPGNRSVAPQGTRTFGDKGQPRIVGLSNKGKLALGTGAAAAAAGLYKAADKPKAEVKAAGGARPGERTSGYPAAKRAESKPPVPKAKPAGGSSSGATKPVKAAGDKSSQANKGKPTSATGTPAKKMTAFERQKARMYEKEGYGGRSMTAAQAKARVEKERGQKMEMPRFLKSSSKEAPKKASGMARPQYKSQKARDFAAKMQGRNPSGKAEKSFRFKDLFK